MAVHENNSRNVVMSSAEAIEFVNNNNAIKLCDVIFEKPNTVSVPIMVSRLQAGAGLVNVGSVVDIYKSNNDTLFANSTHSNKSEADVCGCTVLSIMRY